MELARYLQHTLQILSSARAIEEENKALRASLRVNTSTLLFRAFPSTPPPPFFLPPRLITQLSCSHLSSAASLCSIKGSDFQDGAFLFGAFFFFFYFFFFLKNTVLLAEFVSRWRKKNNKNLTLEKKKRDVLAWRRCPNPPFRTQMWKFDFAGLVLTCFHLAASQLFL